MKHSLACVSTLQAIALRPCKSVCDLKACVSRMKMDVENKWQKVQSLSSVHSDLVLKESRQHAR